MKESEYGVRYEEISPHLDGRQYLTQEEKEDYIRKIWNSIDYMVEIQFEEPEDINK